ncbi:MAG TPA: helix-turn-helix transcriptional regulator [Gallicola sp.]|nr:helix-turn-helix transcriptional regulator [Gallicola sp.]
MKKKKVFISVLLSYIIMMITPMIILGIILFNFFYNFYEDEALSNRVNTLHKIQITFDEIINEMNSNAYLMFNSKEFSTLYLKQDYGNFYDVVRKLSSIISTNNFIDDILFINDDLKKIYSTQTMYDYSQLGDMEIKNTFSEEEISELLLKNRSSYWLPVQKTTDDSKGSLTYVVINKIGVAKPKNYVSFKIDTSTLNKLTGEFISGTKSCVSICDYGNNLLYTSNPNISDYAWDIWKSYPDKKNDKPNKINVNGQIYVVYMRNSVVSPIKYVSIIPYESIISPIKYYKILFFVGIITITATCTLFIFYFMKINYAPIRALSKLAVSFFGETEENINEFEITKKALKKAYQQNSRLICDRITFKLMRGGYDNLQVFRDECSKVGYKLPGPYFQVIGFNIIRKDVQNSYPLDIDRYQKIAKFIGDTVKMHINAYTMEYSEDNTIYVVVSGTIKEMHDFETKLQQIKCAIEDLLEIWVLIGVGNVVEINQVIDSSSQASIATKYQLMKGRGGIVYYKDTICENNNRFVYPTYAVNELYQAILIGDEDKIHFYMDILIKYISDCNSLFFGTCLTYEIINVTMKAMSELNYSFSFFDKCNLVKKGIITSVDEIVQIVNTITSEIINLISSKRESFDESQVFSTFEQIMKYISEHYCEQTFSLKSVADRFGMTVSNFSHYFKKHTGNTASEYISLLRLKKAKELLRTSDISLEKIAHSCGYLHVTTLMRQFKRFENITPGSYRAQLRN